MDWKKIAETYRNEFIEKTQVLLRIPTLLETYDPENLEAPFGNPIRQALDWFLYMGEADGFKIKNIDNYAGHLEMGSGKEVLGILGHLDVVPTGGKWNYPPFGATLEDGKIYARGAMDDKGPSMAAYIAMKMVKDQHLKLNKKVRLILGCDEESGMRCIRRYLEKEQMPDIGFAPDADFPLIYGEKGNLSWDIVGQENDDLITSIHAGERYNVVPDECVAILKKDVKEAFNAYIEAHQYQGKVEGNKYTIYGKNSHAAWPYNGVNAIFLMAEFLKDHTTSKLIDYLCKYQTHDYYGKKLGIDHFDPEMKELTINLAIINYENNEFKVGVNIRYPKGFDFDQQTAKIEKSIVSYGFKYVPHKNSKPHYVSPEDPLVKTLLAAYQKYSNDYESPIVTIGGGTYARTLKKAVAFGPNLPKNEDLAHQPNEYLVIDEMIMAAAIYAEAIEKLCTE
ncbi:MAG: dipeptidase PepV [Tenericutes bacterium HGW-Tenericutes-1]|jgi:succinyl-diaminopimelate desuccinylase|nr:MAG: dipeptidase PepV [Tenericutes bacterium HGW-Tenericutes-1]